METLTGQHTEWASPLACTIETATTLEEINTLLEAEEKIPYVELVRRIAAYVDLDGSGATIPIIEHMVYDGDHIALTFDGVGTQTHRYLHDPQID